MAKLQLAAVNCASTFLRSCLKPAARSGHACYLAPEATAAQERALSLYPREWRTDITKVKLCQAISLIRDRDVNGGLDHALASIEALPASRRTTSIKRLAGQVVEALPKEKSQAMPAARELQSLTTDGARKLDL